MKIYDAILPIREAPKFEKLFHSPKGICPLPGALLQRIEDFTTIADRCADGWLKVAEEKPETEFHYGERLYLVFVEKLFSFVIFTLNAWTCLGGYDKLIRSLAEHIEVAPPAASYEVHPKTGLIRDSGIIKELRAVRNKAVAHIAQFEGTKKDTPATRDAYFNWSWGPDKDLRKVKFIAGTIAFTKPNHSDESRQVKLPPFDELRNATAEEVRPVAAQIGEALRELATYLPKIRDSVELRVQGTKEEPPNKA